jgi:EAL domain-containing protein (putative c-di-GMP-specific phosphodiesterase class I)
MTDPTASTVKFRSGLAIALHNNAFCLYAQPIAALRGSAATGTFQEILVRLREEETKMLPPGAFLPLLEENGMMPALDRWVAAHVLKWIAQDPARQQGVYSINISGQSLGEPRFALSVLEGLRTHKLPGRVLCFELPESIAAENESAAASFVSAMGKAGCATALAQFGRSDASLRMLRTFRPDYLKIDGNVVLRMLRDAGALAKVKAIAQVAAKIGAQTVAEMVEDQETIAALRTAGIDFAQGFGVGLPGPIDEIARPGPVISPP